MISDTKLDSSRYEVISMNYKENPKKDVLKGEIKRKYMDTQKEQLDFCERFEKELNKQGMFLIKDHEHPLFINFKILNKGVAVGEITIYL